MLRASPSAQPLASNRWAGELSISGAPGLAAEKLVTSAQITDVYLAALAMRKGGRLVTFDPAFPWPVIPGGSARLIENPSFTAMP